MTAKFWTFLITTLLLVTSCSKSEVVTSYEQVSAGNEYTKQQPTQQEVNNNPVPIVFDTNVEGQATTRGVVNSEADLALEGFSVFAYYTGTNTFSEAAIPNLMYNQHVTGSSADGVNYTWSYTPVKYWPNNEGDKVTFFAYGTHAAVTQDASDNTRDATGLASGITAISGNGHSGVPYLIYKLDAETVDIGDMRDLLYATGSYNNTKPSINDKISFSFNHALSAFGFGVCGVFNEVGRGTSSGNDYLIDENNYIRIEEIVMKVTLPREGRLSLDGNWTTTPDSEGEITFNMNASNIAENLRYTDYVVRDEESGDIDVDATTTQAATLLSYGVGRYKEIDGESLPVGFSLSDGDKIPNSGTDAIYQKVGLTGTAQQNLFYFIPASSTGDITFNFTITYHTLTRDSRMLYGIGDVKNVVSNSATISVAGGDNANSKIYMFNLQLGMTKVKINGVTMDDYYLSNEDSTPWNSNYSSDVFYYTVPK